MSGRTNDLSSELIRAFSILELPPSADFVAVKSAYRELAKVWHPDRFEGDVSTQRRAQEKLKQINAAYETLERFFARQPGLISSEPVEAKPANSPTRSNSTRSESRPTLSIQLVSAAPWLIALLFVGIVVGLVLHDTRPQEPTPNQGTAPVRTVEPLPASAPNDSESVKSASTIQEPATTQTEFRPRKGPLTQEEKELILTHKYSLDPKEWDYEGGKPVKKQQAQELQIQLPKSVKFVVVTDSETYYSEREPKPFGSGFKLTDVVRNVDVIVTGKIQIIKIPPPKN